MNERNSQVFRILAALLLLGFLTACGAVLYQAGVSQGYLQAAALGDGEGINPGPGFHRYGGGWMRPHFGFFPFFPLAGLCLFPLVLLLLFGFLFRGRRWGGWNPETGSHPHPHPWGPPPPAGAAPNQPAPQPAPQPDPATPPPPPPADPDTL